MRYHARMAFVGVQKWIGLACGVALLGSGCGDDGGDGGAADSTPATTDTGVADTGTAGTADETAGTGGTATRPNWHEDIAPLVAEHCVGCHTAGGVTPFTMDTYEETWPLAPAMALQAEAGEMPPWHAVETEDCTPYAPFLHDARMSDEEIQMLRDWSDIGTPEGDPANAAPLPEPPSSDLAEVTATVTSPASIEVEADGNTLDFFHCLSFDPGNTQDVYVDGFQVVPGNRALAHHTLIYLDLDAGSADWEDGVQYDCGGGAGDLSNAQLVGAWVPGQRPFETPEDVGILLPAGARIVYNMHYHASVTGPQTDTGTALSMHWTETAPTYVSQFSLIGAPGAGTVQEQPFLIPAGASGHREVVEYRVPEELGGLDLRVWSALNHMHKVGVDMRVTVLAGGDETCLVQTPNWDFNWQRSYTYDLPIAEALQVQPGDVVRVECTYDNTMDNPAVVEALNEVGLDEPQDVTLGEGTLDEMCLTGVGVAYRFGAGG